MIMYENFTKMIDYSKKLDKNGRTGHSSLYFTHLEIYEIIR